MVKSRSAVAKQSTPRLRQPGAMADRQVVLSFDDRRRIAAAYDVFARVDARRKAAKRSRRKSKPRDEKKPRSPSGLRGFIFVCSFFYL
jgi:hypothetical protein